MGSGASSPKGYLYSTGYEPSTRLPKEIQAKVDKLFNWMMDVEELKNYFKHVNEFHDRAEYQKRAQDLFSAFAHSNADGTTTRAAKVTATEFSNKLTLLWHLDQESTEKLIDEHFFNFWQYRAFQKEMNEKKKTKDHEIITRLKEQLDESNAQKDSLQQELAATKARCMKALAAKDKSATEELEAQSTRMKAAQAKAVAAVTAEAANENAALQEQLTQAQRTIADLKSETENSIQKLKKDAKASETIAATLLAETTAKLNAAEKQKISVEVQAADTVAATLLAAQTTVKLNQAEKQVSVEVQAAETVAAILLAAQTTTILNEAEKQKTAAVADIQSSMAEKLKSMHKELEDATARNRTQSEQLSEAQRTIADLKSETENSIQKLKKDAEAAESVSALVLYALATAKKAEKQKQKVDVEVQAAETVAAILLAAQTTILNEAEKQKAQRTIADLKLESEKSIQKLKVSAEAAEIVADVMLVAQTATLESASASDAKKILRLQEDSKAPWAPARLSDVVTSIAKEASARTAEQADPQGEVFFDVVLQGVNLSLWKPLRLAIQTAVQDCIEVQQKVDKEVLAHMDLVPEIVTVSESTVSCPIRWTPPMHDRAMIGDGNGKSLAASGSTAGVKPRMIEVEEKIIQTTNEGGLIPAEDLTKLLSLLSTQMSHYRGRVLEVQHIGWECYYQLPMVVQSLKSQYKKVYSTTGDLVQAEGGFTRFNNSAIAIDKHLSRDKPKQPINTIVDLLLLSAAAKPVFDEIMQGVADRAGRGVEWLAAPLKKCFRIAEKLCLDPNQLNTLLQGDPSGPDALDASGMLDSVRGMLLCINMVCSDRALQQLDSTPGCTVMRIKNRFVKPSDGGWMDALVNVEIAVAGANVAGADRIVAEVQIIHRQLYTVRKQLGAHASYAVYRSATELLECTGNGALLQEDALKWVGQQLGGNVGTTFLCRQMLSIPKEFQESTQHTRVIAPWRSFSSLEIKDAVTLRLRNNRISSRISTVLLGSLRSVSAKFSDWETFKEVWKIHHPARPLPLWTPIPPAHKDEVLTVCVTPDGKHIVSGSKDKTIRIIRVDNGQLVRKRKITGQTGWVRSVCVTPDGQHIVSGFDDKTIRITRVDDGLLVREITGHTGEVNSVCVTPDGQHIVSGSRDKTIRITRVDDGELVREITGHFDGVRTVCVTPDGKHVVSGSRDKTIRITRVDNGKLVREITGHASWVRSVCITPDGQHVVSGSDDKTIRITRVDDGELVREITGHTSEVNSVCVTPDGQHIVSGSVDKTIRITRVDDGQLVREIKDHSQNVHSVCVTPDSQHIVSGSGDKTIRITRVDDGHSESQIKGHVGWVFSVCVSPDGQHVVSGSEDNTIRITRVDDGQLVREIKGHSREVRSVCMTPDGQHVVSGSKDKTIRITRIDDGQLVREIKGHFGWVMSVCVTPDGRHIVSGSDDKTIRITRVDDGQLVRKIKGHSDWVRSVCITADGQHIVSGSSDKTIRITRVDDGHVLREIKGHSDWVNSVCVTPDGKHIVSGSEDKTIRITRVDDGQLVREITGHTGEVRSVCMTPDGQHVISGSKDKTIRIIRVDDGQLVREITGHNDGVFSVCVTPDGRHVVSGSDDETIRVSPHLFYDS